MLPHYIVARCLLYDYLRNLHTDRLGNHFPSQLNQSSNHPIIQPSNHLSNQPTNQPTNHPAIQPSICLFIRLSGCLFPAIQVYRLVWRRLNVVHRCVTDHPLPAGPSLDDMLLNDPFDSFC